MSENNSLTIFTRAALMLAEADTIQKAKELKDLAITAGDWARRKDAGEEAIRFCRSYALEAERRIGELLLATAEDKTRQTRGGDRKSKSLDVTLIQQPTLADIGITKRESAEAQKLATMSQPTFDALKAGEKTKKEAMNPTHVGHNSGENEWYTPPEYITSAVAVMGGIDVDPASSAIANKTVGAAKFYTKEDDGLRKKWTGRVWMNPPYAQPLIGSFAEMVTHKFIEGETTEAIVLVNNATETQWFQRMAGVASAVCFPKGRVRFLDPAGNPGAPLQGQAILYFGKSPTQFYAEFKQYGATFK